MQEKQKTNMQNVNNSSIDSLFNQTKDLKIIGERLSGEPEIVHEIEDYFRQVEFYPITRNQIRAILEHVPITFPEDWKSPEGYNELTSKQKQAYADIAKKGVYACTGPVIQRVIELAIDYRKMYTPK